MHASADVHTQNPPLSHTHVRTSGSAAVWWVSKECGEASDPVLLSKPVPWL